MSSRQVKGKWLLGNPEWEAMKAAGSKYTPRAAARLSAALTEQYHKMRGNVDALEITLDGIVQALNDKKIPFVLTGAHGIGSWTGRPRSTHDVDILVKGGRNHMRAVKALKERYPQLEVRSFFGVAGFFLPGETDSVIDVTYPHRADIEETLRTAIWAEEGTYRIPALEAALANKYGAMLTLSRKMVRRAQDAVDFSEMVNFSMREDTPAIDLEKLRELGEKVWPGGGGEEILRLVEEVKAGKVPNPTPQEKLSG